MVESPVREPGFLASVKEAFLFRWNLLLFGGGIALSLILNSPDVLGALVLAGEVGYLALLSSHPRFRAAVGARRHKAVARITQEDAEAVQERILAALSERERTRFDELKDRCVRLFEITRGLQAGAEESGPLESARLQGVDRLLWVYLKLLYTKHSIERFLESTDAAVLEREREALRKRLESLGPSEKDSPHQAEVRRSLDDTIRTCEARLDNHRKAGDNHDFVDLELRRLENKISSILESAVNRQDPGFITNQVDAISGSMSETERTMSELQFLTGLDGTEESAPPILRKETQ